MLAKLLKYEFKSTSRVVLILYAVLLAMGLLIGILLRTAGIWTGDGLGDLGFFDGNGGNAMTIVLVTLFIVYWALIMAALIMTTITIVARFYRNLLSGEGYLMHTLPVETRTLVNAKLITAFVWMLITGLAILLSGFILVMVSGLLPAILREVGWTEFVSQLKLVFGNVNLPLWIITMIIGTISGILVFYFSMALGNLANEHKILFSVLAYIGINTVMSFVSSLFNIRSILGLETATEVENMMSSLLIRSSIINVILAIGFYIGTTMILKKRLNLA